MKRLISLTMAAACALSLAVPAFAATTSNDSGYDFVSTPAEISKVINNDIVDLGEVVTTVPEATAATIDNDGAVTLAKATKPLEVSFHGTTLKVAANGQSILSQYQEMARKIDKTNGYEAQLILYGTEDFWKAANTITTYVRVADNDSQAGKVEIQVIQSPTADLSESAVPSDIDDLELWHIFQGYNTAAKDVRAFYEAGDGNSDNGVLPNKTVYFVINDVFYKTSNVEFDLSKAEGSKYVKSIKDTQKSFSTTTLTAVDNNQITLPSGRYRVLEVKLKENMTDDEFKLLFDLRVKCKEEGFLDWKKGDTKKFEDIGETWVGNDTWTGDSDWVAGQGGVMVKPEKNEDNEIIWYDENRDIAKVEFYADSDTDKFFVKLSTKWNNEWYSDMFRNTDAFIFNFVGAPKISATSRATLTIYNPFVNEDEELEVDLDELKVYKVLDTAALAATTEEAIAEAIADGRIEDVTNLFTAGENEDGDQVLTTRTRDLGTYIVTTATPADLVDDVVVDSTNNGKVNPGTGR